MSGRSFGALILEDPFGPAMLGAVAGAVFGATFKGALGGAMLVP